MRRCQVSLEVVDDLRHHPAPVDRVDAANAEAPLELEIARNALDDVLAIIEHAVKLEIKNIGVVQRIHLRALKFAHSSLGRQHEDIDALAPAHCVFRGRAGVAGRCAQNVQMRTALFEYALEQGAEQLHRQILECEGGTIGKLEQCKARFQPAQRRDVARAAGVACVAEIRGGVGSAGQRRELVVCDIVGELADDRARQVRVRKRTPGVELGDIDARIRRRHIQSTVGCQARQQNLAE